MSLLITKTTKTVNTKANTFKVQTILNTNLPKVEKAVKAVKEKKTTIKEVAKKDDIIYQHITLLSEGNISHVKAEITNTVYSIIRDYDYSFYRNTLLDNKGNINYKAIEEYLNKLPVPTDNTKIMLPKTILNVALLIGYFKATYNNGIEKLRTVSSVNNKDKEYHVNYKFKDYENNKIYAEVDNTDIHSYGKVDNYFMDKVVYDKVDMKNSYERAKINDFIHENFQANNSDISDKYNMKELHNNIELFQIYERLSLNTFNHCYLDFLKYCKEYSDKYEDTKKRLIPLYYDKDNSAFKQYRRLTTSLAYRFNFNILRSASEGLKGNKTDKDKMNFISIYQPLNDTENEDTIGDFIADNKNSFDNFIKDYNLNEVLNQSEKNILFMLSVGYTVRDIAKTLHVSNQSIAKLKNKVYQIVSISQCVDKAMDKVVKAMIKTKYHRYTINKQLLTNIRSLYTSHVFINDNVKTNYNAYRNNIEYVEQPTHVMNHKTIIDKMYSKKTDNKNSNEFTDINTIPYSLYDEYDFTSYNDYTTNKADNYSIAKRAKQIAKINW